MGTLVWAALEPIDRRVFRHDYSDVALLGKAFTRGRGWLPLGLAIHAAYGALFGLVLYEIAERRGGERRRLALRLALIEHLALFSTGAGVRPLPPSPGRGGGSPKPMRVKAFGQATVPHAVFGLVPGPGAQDGPSRPR